MRKQSGQAMVEFSLILPILAIIFLFAGAITILTVEAVRYGTLVRNELMDWERDRMHRLRQSVLVNRTPYPEGHAFNATWVELVRTLEPRSNADPCVRFVSDRFSVSVGFGNMCMTPVFVPTPTPVPEVPATPRGTPKITITITRRITPPGRTATPTAMITPEKTPTPTATIQATPKPSDTPTPVPGRTPTRLFPGP